MVLKFGSNQDLYWDLEFDEARLRIRDLEGSHVFVGRVSQEALEDAAGVDHLDDPLEFASKCFPRLTDIWASKRATGQIESDGSVLVRSFELT